MTKLSSEDSRISKLTYKAGRVMDTYTADAKSVTEEKEILQSFISDMSHQMKTPLSGISMYSSLLLEGNLSDEEQYEFLSRIHISTEKLQWMIDCLVKMSRLEVDAVRLSPCACGIKQTLSESISSVLSEAEKKEITISVREFDDVQLYHDRKWTREVFANILENAVKYSPAGGVINIEIEYMTLYSKVIVTDRGIGIKKEDWNLIFKRFYRGANTEGYDGAGLGLYIASLIMEKQGGYITVDSKPGEYTSFSIFLQNRKN
ncbi:MAG: sensor histidine kinase [Eubacteriales bacterium]